MKKQIWSGPAGELPSAYEFALAFIGMKMPKWVTRVKVLTSTNWLYFEIMGDNTGEPQNEYAVIKVPA